MNLDRAAETGSTSLDIHKNLLVVIVNSRPECRPKARPKCTVNMDFHFHFHFHYISTSTSTSTSTTFSLPTMCHVDIGQHQSVNGYSMASQRSLDTTKPSSDQSSCHLSKRIGNLPNRNEKCYTFSLHCNKTSY